MNYQVYDLGQLKGGQRVEVTLSGSAANVRLMDSSNYQSYKSGRGHRFEEIDKIAGTKVDYL